MLDLQHPASVTLVLFFLHLFLRRLLQGRRSSILPLPPGPKGYAVIGNLFDMPTSRLAHGWSNLLNRYGDMTYLEAFGTKILVLGSLKQTTELFERRSLRYSDRPEIPMFSMMGFGAFFSVMPYGSEWRRQRKMFHEHFNQVAIARYHPLILEERSKYIQDLLEDPAAFWERTRTYFARAILRTTYAIEPKGNEDPFIRNPQIVAEGFGLVSQPGAFLVDLIPALRYVPDWMPGTGWKRLARYYNEATIKSIVLPFQHVYELHRQGNASPSVSRSLIEEMPSEDNPEFEGQFFSARGATAIAYIAGSDTSLGVALATLRLLTIHADVQRRAQAEIDNVVEHGKLPDFSDREELVYLRAILKEVVRVYQVFPLGIAHAALEDDEYDGYFIPKGTAVFGHSWHILHDPEVYPDPFTFNPDRFIRDGKMRNDILDPFSITFGFGRRICPGRHFSHDTVFALISAVLACFRLSPPKDANGVEIPLEWEEEGAMLVHPKRFRCEFTPRATGKPHDQ